MRRCFRSAPPLRRTFADHSRLKHGRSCIIGSRRGAGSYAPFNHWCRCPKVSLGPSRPPFIGEVSPEALPQARVHHDSHLGPVPPAAEFRSATVSKPAAGRPGRWGGGECVSNPQKPLNVFQASARQPAAAPESLNVRPSRENYGVRRVRSTASPGAFAFHSEGECGHTDYCVRVGTVSARRE